ncbi:hypothetical protein [Lederbergia lenta]|uniref:hypothetical protein n=1 Tax=Lederbergia lenta TaxID=1467 RepID=UPI0020422842|nr:hypothetical protein [Lederbergia lenta]MCM3111970.1 hypothetical protein [Lederbergia lenta]
MKKSETFTLLTLIANYYDQFEIDQKKVDTWHKALKPFMYKQLEENLLVHVAESPYPPRIVQLVRKQTATSRMIPSIEETSKCAQQNSKPAQEQVIQNELKKMRAILGINRGEEL